MSDLTDAIEAAAAPIWHYSNPEYPIRDCDAWQECRDLARQVLQAAAPAGLEAQIRADERAKVAEEIAAVQPPQRVELPAWFDGYREGLRVAAAIARGHAVRPAETAVGAISAPPEGERTSEGSATATGPLEPNAEEAQTA